ncbi:hypothetical protein ACFLR4_02850 [Bacteroidota bacterium]
MRYLILISTALLLSVNLSILYAQEDVEVVPTSSDAEESLDLQAIAELFKDSETLEDFEKSLNNPDVGVNNLDLNDDKDVDYISVVDTVKGDTHFIILRVLLGIDDYQDIAFIEVVKTGDEEYEMEIRGDEEIYGADYRYAPAVVNLHTWPLLRFIYGPAYHPYRSIYKWGHYPVWWKPYRPVKVNVYHTRIVKYKTRKTFVFTRNRHLKTVPKIKYIPRRSKLVKKNTIIKPAKKAGTNKVIKKGGKKIKTKANQKKGGKKTPGKKR